MPLLLGVGGSVIFYFILELLAAGSAQWCSDSTSEMVCYLQSELQAPSGNKECWEIDESYSVLRCCEYPETKSMWCTSIEDPCNTWEEEEWQGI